MNEFNYDDSAYLAHHGIKGMKWGVRKDKSSYRTSDTIKNRIKKASFSRGNENYVRLGRHLELATNAPARKAMRKRHAKGMAVAAGLAATSLGAAAIAGGISAANKKKRNGYSSQNDPILNNIRENEAQQVGQDKINDYMKYRRAKDIQNQIKNGRGINYI